MKFFLFIALFIVFISCKKSDNLTSSLTVKDVVGTYSATEDNLPMQFVLYEDLTGYENYKGQETRPFTWKIKNNEVIFVYDGETTEWVLPIDVEKGEITYGTLVYKKE
jgi:hypothetical protein